MRGALLAVSPARGYSFSVYRIRFAMPLLCAAFAAGCARTAPRISVLSTEHVMVSRVIASDVEPKDPDCELKQLNSIPSSGARDLGIIRVSGGVSDSSLKADDALKFVHQRACEMGADAITIEQKKQGEGDSAQYQIIAHAIAYPQSSGQAGPARDQQHDKAEATRARTVEIPGEAGEHTVEAPGARHARMVEIPMNGGPEAESVQWPQARESHGPEEMRPEGSSGITESSIPSSAAAPLKAPPKARELGEPASAVKRYATKAGVPPSAGRSAVASTAKTTSAETTSSTKAASAKAASTAIAGSSTGIPSGLATPKIPAEARLGEAPPASSASLQPSPAAQLSPSAPRSAALDSSLRAADAASSSSPTTLSPQASPIAHPSAAAPFSPAEQPSPAQSSAAAASPAAVTSPTADEATVPPPPSPAPPSTTQRPQTVILVGPAADSSPAAASAPASIATSSPAAGSTRTPPSTPSP